MPSPRDPVLDGLRSQHPASFKKLKWKLTFAMSGLLLFGFALLAILGLFDLQRTSAAAVENREWRQLQLVVEEMRNDEGAKALYAQVGKGVQGCTTEAEFLQLLGRIRPRLEPLPAHVPRILWGRASCTVQDHGKARLVWIAYRNQTGLRISTRWENGTLRALSID